MEMCRRAVRTVFIAFALTGSAAGCAETPDHAAGWYPDDGFGSDGGVAVVAEEIVGGTADISTPQRNAVVTVTGTGSCTGTLVAPDVVLTAGHCNQVVIGSTGEWEQLPDGRTITIGFGPNPAAPILSVRTPWVNHIRGTDQLLVGLLQPVPSSVAVPRAVHFAELGTLPISSVFHSGYGAGTALTPRATSTSSSFRFFQAARDTRIHDNMICASDGGNLVPGDSGSPWFANSILGPVIGVHQGGATCGTALEHPNAPRTPVLQSATATFTRGSERAPDVNAWLQRNILRSFCSRARPPSARGLYNWYSVARGDNFATSNDDWRGCFTDWDRRLDFTGYRYFRSEGFLETSGGTGKIALHAYWNHVAGDNATATSASDLVGGSTSNAFVETLGYIFTSSAPGRAPLRLWFSGTRGDHLTTTDTIDYTAHGYTLRRTLGYIRTTP